MARAAGQGGFSFAAIGLLAAASAALLAGCSSVSSTGTSAQVRTANGAAPRTRHGVSLAVSSASSSVIQPQPPAGSCHARGSGLFSLPDRRCTPGAISSRVTQANIQATICSYGYTRAVRPPESVTEPEKRASLAAYGDVGPLHAYEYDHLVPLELGGAPNDPRNLWPEPGATPNPKDELEGRLREMVCGREMTLAQAQLEIARDWVTAMARLFRHSGAPN
jgi:hypothetical protein